MLESNNPRRQSWVEIPEDSDFPIQNLPFGILSRNGGIKKVGVAIGNYAVDLSALYDFGYLDPHEFSHDHFQNDYLNDLLSLGKEKVRALRERISFLLSTDSNELKNDTKLNQILFKASELDMHLPVKIGDYTDFYSSEDHARNVGKMFRDPENALLPNWKHIPVGYHGRSSSIIPSGVAIHRPKGQTIPKDSDQPIFGPSKLLDFELEMAFITYPGKELGDSISTSEAEDYIFGMVIMNDWSARDIQKWEYVPLGPFLAKNFASSISTWIVTMDALEPFQTSGPVQDPEVLSYLKYEGNHHYDIHLDVMIKPENAEPTIVSQSNYKHMYWNMAQQLAHHTVNGCNIHGGDMMASGTISGPTPDSFGSMLEISWQGTKSITLSDGTERKFIQDKDTVIMKGYCHNEDVRIGFGELSTKVLPSK
ncbi:fumarylacetoacetase [Salibacteraceae bacterium]|jgi:fumarylacetoacetase|nr:fumarylacetoacetase [Salibacteraceae bacterium]MDB9710212.1 fumarylacetoacetase [Salibacteraceae bacterium]MDC1304003.1 fumarylacetoacetase [Salibacteraceae bacterium]